MDGFTLQPGPKQALSLPLAPVLIHCLVLLLLFTRLFHSHHPGPPLCPGYMFTMLCFTMLCCPSGTGVNFLKGPSSSLLAPLHCQGTEWQKMPLHQIGPRSPGCLCPACCKQTFALGAGVGVCRLHIIVQLVDLRVPAWVPEIRASFRHMTGTCMYPLILHTHVRIALGCLA